jgi:hypothetical protein
MPGECDSGDSLIDVTKLIDYNQKELESIPQEVILGVGCGAPINHTQLKEGETVVDLGSGVLTKENYLSCIRDAGFKKINILEERSYMDGEKINVERLQVW